MEFRKHTLENGLQIVAECNAEAYSLAMGFFVRAGSRDESDEISGVSHFLEHMAFKGTPHRSADEVNREFDDMGAYYNAFTSEECTAYYAAVLPEFQTAVLDLLSDIMRPSLREEDFRTEKEVILEEISMYDDQPPFRADDECRWRFYGEHPLHRSVLGTVESVSRLQVDAMREYFRRRYAPENITIAAAGNVDFEQLVRETESRCGGWEPVAARRQLSVPQPKSGQDRLVKESAVQEYVVQWAQGPDGQSPLRYAAHLLAMIVGDSSGSRLFWELVDCGRAESATLSYHENEDTGLFSLFLCCSPERIDENLRQLDAVIEDAAGNGVSDKELQLAKNKVRARMVLGSERPQNRLFGVGLEWMVTGEYRTLEEDLARVEQVTGDDIRRLVREFPLTEAYRVVVGPPQKNT